MNFKYLATLLLGMLVVTIAASITQVETVSADNSCNPNVGAASFQLCRNPGVGGTPGSCNVCYTQCQEVCQQQAITCDWSATEQQLCMAGCELENMKCSG